MLEGGPLDTPVDPAAAGELFVGVAVLVFSAAIV